ncbi:hypothetical protein PFTANZ_01492 [Plasmodium falciparum Tanzania (2000708)]|uniref:Erythrocyte membrane protein 1 n=1 Tax=Plasmodium falciparum Tanzania (2000708) TaxID=1036725 RepID=A0A024WAQ4_PLAFA|nr:hypothetical protein PFTANZ_01492 [Plasmodium falciparum Tanzania (2000708)]
MAPGPRGKNVDLSVKHLFDRVGEKVHNRFHTAALERGRGLQGHLSQAKFEKDPNDQQTPQDPCQLNHEYHTTATEGHNKENPCEKRSNVRFSYTEGAECDKSKIKGNKDNKDKGGKSEGACAPFRRLSLCDYNLENISDFDHINNDTLLADVCLAAKFEGDSLENYRAGYQEKYPDSHYEICTELARSFADIGDIIRGKDLYRGDKEEKKKLEKKLKTIFDKIKRNNPKLSTLEDEEIREYWWALNRETVWKAITCNAVGGKYFRQTACSRNYQTGDKCRCATNYVPTYFDYVPQFLRWFEEWAEDFCRKKKKRLEDVKTNCRGPSGKDKYCSRNGYDCERTIYKKGYFVIDKGCNTCSVSCRPYESWIDNQKKEFEKQKKKCENEISGNSRHKRSAIIKDYKAYDKEFYEILKSNNVGGLDKFLELLSNENECKNIDGKGGKIDFNNTDNKDNKTFYHSEYCEVCPECGVIKEGGTFKKKNENESGECDDANDVYDPRGGVKEHDINFLYSGDGKQDITVKLKDFCEKPENEDGEKNEKWICYYENSNNNMCKMTNAVANYKNHAKIMSFNDFFNFWVAHLLTDTIDWRKKLNSCIKAAKSKTCEKSCNTKCDCFRRWIEKKKREWEKLKDQYDEQNDFGDFSPYWTLEVALGEELLPIIEKNNSDLELIGEMKKIIEKNREKFDLKKEDDNAIDILLKHELQEAQNCVTNDPEQNCKKKTPKKQPTTDASREGVARSENTDDTIPRRQPPAAPTGSNDDDSEDEDEVEEEENGKGDPKDTVDVSQEPLPEAPQVPTKTTQVNVCSIVYEALKVENLTNACGLKYGSKSHVGWKCVTSGGGESGEAKSRQRREAPGEAPSGAVTATSDKDGAICVPSRRRKLYLHKVGDGEDITDDKSLRDWFVKSAAVETFFLWHRYKKQKEKKPQEGSLLSGSTLLSQFSIDLGDEEQPPEKQLAGGKIPDDFLRQMFYTLGDYRDICIGDENVIKTLKYSGDKDDIMEKIQDKIKAVFPTSGGTSHIPDVKPGGALSRGDWWEQHGKDIWHGMICALTYKETSGSGEKGEKTTITQDGTLKDALLDTDGKKPKRDYQYTSVTLKEDDSGEKAANVPAKVEPTTLADFTRRPAYFRWLEEWGDGFCRERKKRLAQIKKDCYEDGGTGEKQYSGYGEACDRTNTSNEGASADLEGPSCANSCSSYRKWIERKKYEFKKQEKAYGGQKQNCKKERKAAESNDNDKQFCGTPETTCNTAEAFLQNLGSCKKYNGEGKKIFENTEETFKPAIDCEPCSEFKVKLEKCNCGSDAKGNTCTTGKITAENFENKTDVNEVVMRVSDNAESGFKGDLKSSCENAHIFEGIKENKWKCRNVCGYIVCKLEEVNGEKDNGKKILLIRALVTHWVDNFLQDYNKIKKKLNTCMNSSDATPCIKGCVDKWIKLKKDEWEEIKKPYLEQYKNGYGENYNVKTILEKFQDQPEFKKAIGPCPTLDAFEKSKQCNATASSEKGKDGNKSYVIDCLLQELEKLQEKAKKCHDQHSDNPQEKCDDPHPDEPDEEDLLLEEEENTANSAPEICKDVIKAPPKQEEKGGCEPASPLEPEEVEEETASVPPGSEPEADKGPVKPAELPKPPKRNKRQPKKLYFPTPALQNAMLSNTIMWTIGIGFAAISYFFLKKKTKSTIDLLRVINIPKGDYGIPTMKSKNRYVPYKSGQYNGKKYIYMEGDESDDYTYIGDISSSDITSSESEYEDIDINNIYPYKSPKYKTLIDVVLEPSKRDTFNTQSDIPSDTSTNKFTDNEWNQLKQDFISGILENEQKDLPKNNISGNIQMDTHPHVNILDDSMQEKPFITSIHDRNLHNGEEVTYNINLDDHKNMNFSTNHDNIPPKNDQNDLYTGIDLINDSISGNHNVNIYDELLKRKENELFGTNHTKHTTTNIVAKQTHNEPIVNQINLFHKWLDRHRNMCEQWDKNKKEELLDKLNEEWNKENKNNSNVTDTNGENNITRVLNSDVSIQIDMNSKPI